MAYEDRSYSGNAVETTLTANISAVDTTINIFSSVGWPDGTGGPFHVGIAPASTPDDYTEIIRISGRVGLVLTVQTVPVNGRGWDGTTAGAHITGAIIRHVVTATDLDEANQHIANTGLDHHSQYLSVARHDIAGRHGFGILPTAGTPSTSLVGDAAAGGAGNNVARIDHKHARETFGSPVKAGPVLGDGVATSLPRSDHIHSGGIPIIANTAARPASPTTTETVIQTDTKRMVQWDGAKWVRGPHFTPNGRTGVYVSRLAVLSIPNGGAQSTILPWSAELFDSDGFIPTPDGTTTTTITCPNQESSGFFLVTVFFAWASTFTQRSYIEVVHGFAGPSSNQHRVITTGDDRATLSVGLEIASGDTVQFGLWQNSGAAVNANGVYLTMYRLFA